MKRITLETRNDFSKRTNARQRQSFTKSRRANQVVADVVHSIRNNEFGACLSVVSNAHGAIHRTQRWLDDYLSRKEALEQRQHEFDEAKFHWRNPPKAAHYLW